MSIKPLTDETLCPLPNLTPLEETYVERGNALIYAGPIDSFYHLHDNVCIASEKGAPGILAIAEISQDHVPSAHEVVKIFQKFKTKQILPRATLHFVSPNERTPAYEGPAVLIFAPGLETFPLQLEEALNFIFAKTFARHWT